MRSSLAVKTLHVRSTPTHLEIAIVMAIFLSDLVQSLRSTATRWNLSFESHHSFTDHGKRFASSGRMLRIRTFLWEEEAPLPILCGIRDADAEIDDRGERWAREGWAGA